MSQPVFSRLVIVTGASKGIGKAISLAFNKQFQENTLFILTARDLSKLNEVKIQIESESTNNRVLSTNIDFSNSAQQCQEYKNILDDLLNLIDVNQKQFTELYTVYNHGTFQIVNINENAKTIDESFQTNVTSVWKLLTAIRLLFPNNAVKKQYHINISSMLAYNCVPLSSSYSATRIARATLFKCLALEEPTLRVLNYQPGPVYTDMLKNVNDLNIFDEQFKENYESGKLLTPEMTSTKLMKILSDDTFKSGTAVDYYDYE